MEACYSRNIPALSEKDMEILKSKRVLIVGCGGLGGYLSELLVRIGVRQLRLCDPDVFTPSNLNRQLLATASSMGKSKAATAAARAREIDPLVQAEAVCQPLTEENAGTLLDGCDAVVDGLDSIQCRKILAAACEKTGIPYVFGAVEGWVAQAAVIMPGSRLLDTLYPGDAPMPPKSVLSFTPAMCASMQAALCVRLLTGHPVETEKLYHMDLYSAEMETLCIK